MKAERITSTDNRWFAPVWEVYKTSFPINEQRTVEHQTTAFADQRHQFLVYHEGDLFLGFLGIWDFDDYAYIEHFAINPELRGSGWGSRILGEYQQNAGKTIILEIDEVKDDISIRRERFYRNLGWVSNPYKHELHKYQPEHHTDALLQIMTYPEAIDEKTYRRFNDDLHNIVMKR